MQLSTSSLHYRSLPVTEACQRIAKVGFSAVDVWAHFTWAGPLCEHLEEGLQEMGPDAFGPFLKKHELRLIAASCYAAKASDFLAPLGKLGGAVIIRGSQPVQGDPQKITTDEIRAQMKQFLASLKPELELAEEHDCVLAIENHSGRSLLNKLDSMQIFTELNDNPHLGIALAPYHIQLNQESVEDAIRAAGEQIKFFYAWQHGSTTDQLPGIGPTDMRPWLRALADINYQGYVNPFMHHEPEPDEMDEALTASRKYLLQIYEQLFG